MQESIRASALVLFLLASSAFGQCILTLNPGDQYQSRVNACQPSSTFTLAPGLFANFIVTPKSGDTFIGSGPSTVLSGAQTIAPVWNGSYWVVTGLTLNAQSSGSCQPGYPACNQSNDAFYDRSPLTRVLSLSDLVSGRWYYDPTAKTAWFVDDPTDHLVQVSVTRAAFQSGKNNGGIGAVSNVTIENVTVEMYAIPAQMGAIGDQYPGLNWTVSGVTAQLNHGTGFNVSNGGQITNSKLNNNGQEGVTGSGTNGRPILIQNVETGYNNWAGFSEGWEAGGIKISGTNGAQMLDCHSHDNWGNGIWSDGGNINLTISGCTVSYNHGLGISHEIGYAASIKNNIVTGNCFDATCGNFHVWLWGAQINIQNSQNTMVTGNAVTVGAGNVGIAEIEQNRGSGTSGPYVNANNFVGHNSIFYLNPTANGSSGAVTDDAATDIFAANAWDYNTYYYPAGTTPKWDWQHTDGLLSFFRSYGQELHGQIVLLEEATVSCRRSWRECAGWLPAK